MLNVRYNPSGHKIFFQDRVHKVPLLTEEKPSSCVKDEKIAEPVTLKPSSVASDVTPPMVSITEATTDSGEGTSSTQG